jgi:lipid-binding SYLF domain-containing protein
MERRQLIIAAASVAGGMTLLAGCTTNVGASATPAQKKAEIDKDVDAALALLATSVPGSREMAGKSRGMLVFPKLYSAALGIGGEYGEGALRVGGRTVDYYRSSSASFGFQAGAQSRALIFMFMTEAALDKFRKSSGWTAGVDGAVAVAKTGAQGQLDTVSANAEVVVYPLTNAGLMASVAVDGTKISKMQF